MTRPTAVLICPGRGTYNKGELGFLTHHHARNPLTARWDDLRNRSSQETLTALDSASRFEANRHTTGDNASPLIYACSVLDAKVASQSHDIVAVTGNSLGWYIALAAGGGCTLMDGMQIVNTMGTLMHNHGTGGQVLYPVVDDNWQPIQDEKNRVSNAIQEINESRDYRLEVSIELGGMIVVAGDDAGLTAFERAVVTGDPRKPLRLPNHAAFHTALMENVAKMGRDALPQSLFKDPETALIDGRGAIWYPKSTDLAQLRAYTLGHQITQTYNFTAAVQSAARNFAPDRFIITGPGTTLGGAVAQALIAIKWQGLDSKQAFQDRQAADPVIISMGREDQRALISV
ncbi:ACP S-malonyltransferase [Sulfitobacter guttiformis]|uniref:[acyl-carrier-protein] S-malonyltransferase n=1 Tax=Sulfitobacter guttiformis TaxID=74349 RepID=A0A420DHV7_9RHOB|nr:ACP S-malonyltransferase [Sulfitobacter guttiformis]KIN72463.1 Malonyl CoA-acyl carrier protein transacylase [Sulfitobacter guttiformis KCTC 32187]RKE93785.1 [acyl-carrier-protein] S-malonyltransferase [Sulfitobacter guttiformis]